MEITFRVAVPKRICKEFTQYKTTDQYIPKYSIKITIFLGNNKKKALLNKYRIKGLKVGLCHNLHTKNHNYLRKFTQIICTPMIKLIKQKLKSNTKITFKIHK